MAISNSDLTQFVIERLKILAPGIDTSNGSPAYSYLINPLLARLGTDPLSTDVRSFIIDTLSQEFPDIDFFSAGSEVSDILVGAVESIITPLRQAINQSLISKSLANPEQLTNEEADSLLANLLVTRQQGNLAQQFVRCYFSSRRAISIDGTVTALAANGLRYYAVDVYTVTGDEMSLNAENGYYYTDILFEAESEGVAYNVPANSIVRVDGLPGVVIATNLLPFQTGVSAETVLEVKNRLPTTVSERTPTTKNGIVNVLQSQVSSLRNIVPIGFGDPEMIRDIIRGEVSLDENLLGLGDLIDNMSGLDGVSVIESPAVNPQLTVALTSDRTIRFSSVSSTINDLTPGAMSISINNIDHGIAGVVPGGPPYEIVLDDFSIVASGGPATSTAAYTEQSLINSIGLHIPYAVELRNDSVDFAALEVSIGDWLRVTGDWIPPRQWEQATLIDGAGNTKEDYFPIVDVQQHYLTVGPSLSGSITHFGGMDLSSKGYTHNAAACAMTTEGPLVGLPPKLLVTVTSGEFELGEPVLNASHAFGAIKGISSSAGITKLIIEVLNFNFNYLPVFGDTIVGVNSAAEATVTAANDPDTNFYTSPVVQAEDFFIMEKPTTGPYDSKPTFSTQEWYVSSVVDARTLILGVNVFFSNPLSVSLSAGDDLENSAHTTFGTILKVSASEGWLCVTVTDSSALPTNGQNFYKVGDANALTADTVEVPGLADTSTIIWAIRKGTDNPVVGGGGALPQKFLLGNATDINWAVIRYRSDINPVTYNSFLAEGTNRVFSVRSKKTLSDVQGSVSMTIGHMPAGVLDLSTYYGPIVVENNDVVHVGGCVDVYAYQEGAETDTADITPWTDASPVLVNGNEATDKLTIAAGTDLATCSLFSGAYIRPNDILVILEGEYQGPYRIIKNAVGTLRIDSVLANGASAVRFYISRNPEMSLSSPKFWRVKNSAKLTTYLDDANVVDATQDFSVLGVVAGDTLEIITGEDKGLYTVQEVVDATKLRLNRTLSAHATDITYKLYYQIVGPELPFRRITSLEVLDSGGQGTGITIPPSSPVDVRSGQLTNVGNGVKLSGVGNITGTGTFEATGEDLNSFGVSVGDVLELLSGNHQGVYTVQETSGSNITIAGRYPLQESFSSNESDVEYTIGAPSLGTARVYFSEPTMFSAVARNYSSGEGTEFVTEGGSIFVPDYRKSWTYYRSPKETNALFFPNVIKLTIPSVAGGSFAVNNFVVNSTTGHDIGYIKLIDGTDYWIGKTTMVYDITVGDVLSNGVASGTVATKVSYTSTFIDSDTDFEKIGVCVGDQIKAVSVGIEGFRLLPNGANVSGLPFNIKLSDGPVRSVVFTGANPIALVDIIDQLNQAFGPDVYAFSSGDYIVLECDQKLEIGATPICNNLLGFTSGQTNLPQQDNLKVLLVKNIVNKNVILLGDEDLGTPTISGNSRLRVEYHRLGVQRFGPLDMVESGGQYYVDVEIKSLRSGDAYNLLPDTELLPSAYESYGYRFRVNNEALTYSTYEDVDLIISGLVLDSASEDKLENAIAVPGKDLRIQVEVVPDVSTAQTLLTLDSYRTVNSNPLARHLGPAYVYLNISYTGGSSESVVTADLEDLIRQTPPTVALEVSDIYDIFRLRNATTVYGPVEVVAVRHLTDRTTRTIRSKDRLSVGRTSRLLVGNVMVTRT